MARVFIRNDEYWIDYFDADGARHRVKVGHDKKYAEMVLRAKMREVDDEKLLGIKRVQAPQLSLDEAVGKYMDWAKTNKSSWERDLLSLRYWQRELKGKRLADVVKLDVERYKMRRKDEVAPRTLNEEVSCLKRLFYRMMDWGFADRNPVRGVKPLKEPPGRIKTLSADEMERLLDACPPHIRPIVLTAMHTGMRQMEIFSLEWRDLDLARNVLVVRNSKNGERREVPLTATLREALEAIPRRGMTEKVFLTPDGVPYATGRSIRESYVRAVGKAGLVDLRFHDLRHVFASNLRMGGADLFDIKEFLGHKSLAMTMRYAHVTTKRKQDVIKVLDWH